MRYVLASALLLAAITNAHGALICDVSSHSGNNSPMLVREGYSDEFYSLLRAREFEEAARYVSCQVNAGDRLIITDQGFASHTVRMLDGSSKGCVGVIPAEYVEHCQ